MGDRELEPVDDDENDPKRKKYYSIQNIKEINNF